MWTCILVESVNALNDYVLHFSNGIKKLEIKINVLKDTTQIILQEYNHYFQNEKPIHPAILRNLLKEYFPKKVGRFICSTTPTPSVSTNSNTRQ